jgi:hypothetical protein
MSQIKPNFFIVGAPKCGTTSLYEWLRQHPDIFMPDEKEPKFFCHDLRKRASNKAKDTLFPVASKQDYLNLFADAGETQAIGEASTYYLYSDVAPQAIKEFNPEAKIIIMLRDPVAQIISSYNFSVQKGHESAGSLEEALRLEEKRRENPAEHLMPKSQLYTEKASFSKHIKRYQEVFDDKSIKIILLDDLKDSPEDTYQEVLELLDIERLDFTPEFSQENTGGTPRFRWLNQAIKHPNSPIRKMAGLIPKSLAKQIRDGINKFLLSEKDTGVSNTTRSKLKQQFRPEVKKLSKITNRDLAQLWGYDQS